MGARFAGQNASFVPPRLMSWAAGAHPAGASLPAANGVLVALRTEAGARTGAHSTGKPPSAPRGQPHKPSWAGLPPDAARDLTDGGASTVLHLRWAGPTSYAPLLCCGALRYAPSGEEPFHAFFRPFFGPAWQALLGGLAPSLSLLTLMGG